MVFLRVRLKPLLFLFYITDITYNNQGLSMLFADDTSLSYYSIKWTLKFMKFNSQLIQTCLKSKVGHINGSLTLTQWKQNVLFISTNPTATIPGIVVNNENVKSVENPKNVGVAFSNNCKWHCPIQNILKSTSSQLSMLRKIYFKQTQPGSNLFYIYFASFRICLRIIGWVYPTRT
jgi:hypothetical protein